MKLHYAPQSRAVRVAWCLEELGLEYDVERYTLGDPRMRTSEYKKVHPMGRVPALEIDGNTLVESGAIVQFVLARFGNGRLQPAVADPEFAQFLQWFHYSEGMIMPPMNQLVVETILLPEDRRSEIHAKRARKLLTQMLSTVEQQIKDREYLLSSFSAADMMTGHSVVMARRLGAAFDDYPGLDAYADRLESRPAFVKAEAL